MLACGQAARSDAERLAIGDLLMVYFSTIAARTLAFSYVRRRLLEVASRASSS